MTSERDIPSNLAASRPSNSATAIRTSAERTSVEVLAQEPAIDSRLSAHLGMAEHPQRGLDWSFGTALVYRDWSVAVDT